MKGIDEAEMIINEIDIFVSCQGIADCIRISVQMIWHNLLRTPESNLKHYPLTCAQSV